MNRHHHFAFTVLAVAAALAALAARARAAQPYTLTDLGNIGYSATATAVSTVGGNLEVVGDGQETSSSGDSAWYWTQTTGMVDLTSTLSTDLGATGSLATGVNASGQIVGTYSSSSATNGGSNAFVYTIGGTPTEMALPTNFTVFSLSGINDSGLVAGWGEQGNDVTIRPFTYNVNTQAFTELGLAPGNYSIEVNAINSNGWLAGQGGTGVLTAYAWNGSTWTSVGTLAGKTTNSYGIDANGDVVGQSANSAGTRTAFYSQYNGSSWNTMVDLGLVPSSGNTIARAESINNNGQVVGYDSGGGVSDTAFLAGTTAGSAVALSSVVSNLDGWTLEQAMAIDNLGNVVGLGTDASGTSSAFLLSVPRLPGDANGDGKVDVNDLTIVLSHFGQTGQSWSDGDFTGDGKVDVNDLTILLSHFGDTAGAAAPGNVSAVPEPGALLLAAIGLLAALVGLRRRTG